MGSHPNLLFQLMLIPSDLGQIRIRRMGITDKQSRIIEIYGHFGDQNHKAEQTQILKMIDKWYPMRNVICHSECLGMSIKAHPGSLVIITSNLIKMCRARGWWYIIQYKRSKMLLGLLPFRPMQYRG